MLILDNAFSVCKHDADNLLKRFENDFIGCTVLFWKDFVWLNKRYEHFKSEVFHLYETDENFKNSIKHDVEKLSADYFLPNLNDKELFYSMTQLDLIEMITGIKVMHAENFRVPIYPGSMPNSFAYLKKFPEFNMVFVNASIKCRNYLSEITTINTDDILNLL